MFLNSQTLCIALKDLKDLHPFYGITFLTCKLDRLPVGETILYDINRRESDFLKKYYKPISKTKHFFRVFRISEKNKFWLDSKYASSGSQATRTQMFQSAFIHSKNSSVWGWSEDYIRVLRKHLLEKGKKIPAYSLAFWILKDTDISEDETPYSILMSFFDKFHFKDTEIKALFNDNFDLYKDKYLFDEFPFDWDIVAENLKIPPPDDLPLQKGATLRLLSLPQTELIGNLQFEFNNRINIITGDNGLGKTVILETAWWALTQNWTNLPFFPSFDNAKDSSLTFGISNKAGVYEEFTAKFNGRNLNWELNKTSKLVPGLIVFARIDGAFAVFDPTRIRFDNAFNQLKLPSILQISRDDIWNGLRVNDQGGQRSIFNGLLTDWVHWQMMDLKTFKILCDVLKRLSPPDLQDGDLGTLKPGPIIRFPGDSRPIPTILHSYGQVPIILASAAVKRILSLAYLIVWTWREHLISSDQANEDPQKKMVVIIDELEAHLHPKWQRIILPALRTISEDLDHELDIQFIITTHSPLVLASVEPFFENQHDRIFHLGIKKTDIEFKIQVDVTDFVKRGTSDSWLKSESFNLKQPRSVEAENLLENAKSLMSQSDPNKDELEKIDKELNLFLPSHDTFWIRWNYFVGKKT